MNPTTLWLRAQAGAISQVGELSSLLPKSWESTAFLVVTVLILLQKKRIESWIGITEIEQKSNINGKVKYDDAMLASISEKDRLIKELQEARVSQHSDRVDQLEKELSDTKKELEVERAEHKATYRQKVKAESQVDSLTLEIERIRQQRDQLGQTVSNAVGSLRSQGLEEESEQITQEIVDMARDLSKPEITLPHISDPSADKEDP